MARLLSKQKADALFERLAADNPAPQTELQFKDPYTLVVAVALSAQATDVSVNKATQKLFAVADTPKKMIALGEEKLGGYIKTIGLWRNKAKNVIALSHKIIDDFNGEVPTDRDLLETLPGVGRKTANVVCNVAFGQPTIAVDTHIFRVANRTGLAAGTTPLAIEKGLEKIISGTFIRDSHHWLILHGRYVCKARTPDCPACVIRDICLYKDKTEPETDGKKTSTKRATKKANVTPPTKKTPSTKKTARRKAKKTITQSTPKRSTAK